MGPVNHLLDLPVREPLIDQALGQHRSSVRVGFSGSSLGPVGEVHVPTPSRVLPIRHWFVELRCATLLPHGFRRGMVLSGRFHLQQELMFRDANPAPTGFGFLLSFSCTTASPVSRVRMSEMNLSASSLLTM